jgi:hypothetical protein
VLPTRSGSFLRFLVEGRNPKRGPRLPVHCAISNAATFSTRYSRTSTHPVPKKRSEAPSPTSAFRPKTFTCSFPSAMTRSAADSRGVRYFGKNQTGQAMSKKLIEAPNRPRRHERRIYTEKEIELALAWLTGEVRYQAFAGPFTQRVQPHICFWPCVYLRPTSAANYKSQRRDETHKAIRRDGA